MQFSVYDGYSTLDLSDYGFDDRHASEGLPCPYNIVLDKDSRKVLAVHRNWKAADELFREKQIFVKYGLIPGLGFLDYGFLHLIGNQTRAMTAIWQILVDHGMISNFPAGMKVKGVRTSTNEVNPSLGEWVEVDIGNSDDIRKAMMGLPYGQIDPSLIKLLENLQADAEKMSGIVDIEMGSSGDRPAAGILALIEQQSHDLTAVHQRDYRSQKEELSLLRDLFVENPKDLKWMTRKGGRDWNELLAEFTDANLVPASDPNVPSQMHRVMLNQLLYQVAKENPVLFSGQERKIGVKILSSVGFSDADSLVAPQAAISQAMQQAQQQKGGGAGGQGAAAQVQLAKAQMMLPIEQAKVQNDAQRVQLEQEDMQRQAANEAEDHRQRDDHHQAQMELDQVKLLQAERKMGIDEAAAAPDSQDAADLAKTHAQAFSAVGTGAMGFAKAAQTVQQGEAEAKAVENGTADTSSTKPASKSKKTTGKGK